jgi:hypothetical protein
LHTARNHYEQALALTERYYSAEDPGPADCVREKLGEVLQKIEKGKNAHVLNEEKAKAVRVAEVEHRGRVQLHGHALSYRTH